MRRMVAPSRDVPLDGWRALRRRANRGGDEAIAPTRYRLDVARLFRVVVERRTHFADGRLEHRLGDEAMTPDEVEQRVLRHQAAGGACQCAKHCERLRREIDGLSIAQQEGIGLVEFEWAKTHTYRIQGSRGSALCMGHCVRRAERNDIRNIHF